MEKKSKKPQKGLAVVLLAGVTIVIVVLTSITAFLGYQEFTSVLEEQYNNNAYEIAETAKSMLNPDKFTGYLDTLEADDEFNRIQKALDDLTVTTNCRFIYVGELSEDCKTIRYIYDSVNPDLGYDRYPLGLEDNNLDPNYTEDLKYIVETGNRPNHYLYTFIEDHTSAALAVKDSAGKVRAIVVVEKTMDVLDKARTTYVSHVFMIAGGLLVVAVLAYALYLNRRLISPILEVTNEAERFADAHEEGSNFKAMTAKYEIGVLARSVKRMETDIISYIDNLTKVTAEKERIGAELNVATAIQANMLPTIFPPFPERNEFDIFASMTPAKEVGGDFYDFFLIDDDHIALVIADVSGKGVPAALFMVIAKTLIKDRALSGEYSPAKILSSVNEQLCEGNEAELFVTVWLAVIEISTGKGKAANAGHEHPTLKRANGKYELVEYRHSPAVATMEGMRFREHDFELFPGDSVFVYTDGVPEATDANNVLFGNERMLEALNKDPDADQETILRNVKATVDAFVGSAPQFDDLTMLGFKYNGSGAQKPEADKE